MIQYPYIPTELVVHLGAPDAEVANVTVPFRDYIKNVTSSEIFPTWEPEAIRANIYAQLSVALNRFYTGYYRSQGRSFDITSSPAYDQTYVYGRTIFENISDTVDEIFTSYLRRPENIEPLFAQFCDGREVSCDGLSQWGSQALAQEGEGALSILYRYYGTDLRLIENVSVQAPQELAPLHVLREGDVGREVEEVQIKLNRISRNFPAIPKIPTSNSYFGTETTDAVRTFQEVFGLTVDGLVGRSTWYRIQNVYIGVKRLADLNSEGLLLSEFPTQFTGVLEEGDASEAVLTVQYYLNYVALFVPGIERTAIDGAFGPQTAVAVRSFQQIYGLTVDGLVGAQTYVRLQDAYYEVLTGLDLEFREGLVIPFPGRVLREGSSGEDVRALQEYLNFIATENAAIPTVAADGIYGSATADQVEAFQTAYGTGSIPRRVTAATWNAITRVYEDLYQGTLVSPTQYPGYVIS